MNNSTLLAQFVLPSDQERNPVYKQTTQTEESENSAEIKTVRELQEPAREPLETQALVIPPIIQPERDPETPSLWIYSGIIIGLTIMAIGVAIYIRRQRNFQIK